MEILDLYDVNGKRLNKTHIRGNQLKKDEYCIAVDVWIKNDKEQILLTQRHQAKKLYPLKWECTSGFIMTGEDSVNGALRELKEEIGIIINEEELTKIHRIIHHDINIIFDIFLVIKNINIKDLKLQDMEIINAKWVNKNELKVLFKNDEMVEPLNYVLELIEKNSI